MSVINTAALVILGVLLLRKLVLMERYFKARVFLITAFLCGLLLFFVVPLVMPSSPTCVPIPTTPDGTDFYFCPEF